MNTDNQTQLTFLNDTQQSFRSNQSNSNKLIKYVFDLPYNTRREFCNLLDADKSWRELGGKFIKLTETDLELYSHAIQRNESPTNAMLSKWEQTNVTIVYLYMCLGEMKHLRAMTILKSFVDSSLHYMCDFNESNQLNLSIDESKESNPKINNNASNSKSTEQSTQNRNRRSDERLPNNNNIRLINVDNHNEQNINRPIDQQIKNENNNRHHLNVNQFQQNQKQFPQMPIQTPNSQFKGSAISAIASTINAYDDNLPYDEISKATNNFHVSNVIGSGGFGVVYKGFWKGTKVAIKRLKDNGNFAQAITELRVLTQFRIDNIVPLYGISIGGNETCLIYQFMINGSLDDRLQCKHNSQPLNWTQRINIGLGIAKALNYLHTRKGKPLIHGDVKSANILLDSQMQPKLGDFGLAKYLQDYQPQQTTQSHVLNQLSTRKNLTHITVTSVHGTVAYLPPEYLRSKILSPAVDVYSYGIVELEILTGCRAFDGKSLLLDKIMDELEESMNKSSKNCQLLGEFGNLISHKQKQTVDNELTVGLSIEKFPQNSMTCDCLSCKLYKLRDARLPQTLENLFWFHSTLRLALDCCNKLKKKRPDFTTILKNYETFIDQFKQFNQCNQIFNLTGINTNTNRSSIASRISSFKNSFKDDAIKTPLEVKLWNQLKKKNASAPPLPETDDELNQEKNANNNEHLEAAAVAKQVQIDHHSEDQLVNLLSNRLQIESPTNNLLNNQNESNGECFNEFIENCEIPLLTELLGGIKKEN